MGERFKWRTRAGGDPRGLPDYQALCKEIARLSHPACPDVDWQTIERCCLALFASNGADLQTASAYALARSYLGGLDGMSEGVAVLDTLLRGDGKPWPRGVSARAEILDRLFGEWQTVLRETDVHTGNLGDLGLLNVQLEQLRLTLLDQTPGAISTLQGLRRQIVQRALRIERDAQAVALVVGIATQDAPLPTSTHFPAQGPLQRRPAVTQPMPTHIRPGAKKRHALWIGLLAATLLTLIAALAWH